MLICDQFTLISNLSPRDLVFSELKVLTRKVSRFPTEVLPNDGGLAE